MATFRLYYKSKTTKNIKVDVSCNTKEKLKGPNSIFDKIIWSFVRRVQYTSHSKS